MTFYQRILLIAIPGLMLGFIPAPGISLRFGWQLISIWLAAAVFAGTVLRSWWLRLFFILCFLTVLRYGPIATSYLTLLTIAVFMAATEGVRDIEPVKIYDAMTAAAILLLAYGCAQFGGIMRYFPPLSPVSTMGPFNINSASAFFAMCLPVFFSVRPVKIFKWTLPGRFSLLPVPLYGLLMSRSTTGFAAAVAACVVYGALGGVSKKVFVVGMAAALMAGAVFFTAVDPPGKKDMIRPHIWKHIGWSFRSEKLGRGLGSFESLFPVMILSDPKLVGETGGLVLHAHSEYLQAGFEIGIPAMLMLLLFPFVKIDMGWMWRESLAESEKIALAGLAATAVAAAGFHTFHVAPTALLGCVWIGRALGRKTKVSGL